MDNITILSTASNRHVVDAYDEAIRSLKSKQLTVKHVGMASDLWYAGDAHDAYLSYGYEANDLPRISGATTPWWHTTDVVRELMESIATIGDFINDLILKDVPDVFLIADDTGPLEVFLVDMFNKKHIPVVLIEHGYGFAFQQQPRLTEQMGQAAGGMRNTVGRSKTLLLNTVRKGRGILNQNAPHSHSVVPQVKPFGHNGKYLICSFSELTKGLLIRNGINAKTIRDTGYPYFDRLFRIRENRIKAYRQSDQILLVSSGLGTFGYTERARRFYDFVTALYSVLQHDYQISIRLKPGEELRSFLTPTSLRELHDLNIRYDDNSKPSYEAIQDYTLVIGEPSTVLLEAIMLNIPAVLLQADDSTKREYKFSMESILQDTLRLKTISDPGEAGKVIKHALSHDYIAHISARFKENDHYLLHGFDGKAGHRVGQVILEAANRVK